MAVRIAGEGRLDLIVLRRLLADAGLDAGPEIWGEGRNTGKHGMTERFAGWAAGAARGAPILVLRDLDHDAPCAGALRDRLAPPPTPGLMCRIAVRAVEAWFLADRARLADFLGVRPNRLPDDPEGCGNPKQALLDAARGSRRRAIRAGLPPRAGAGGSQGPDYVDRMGVFVRDVWRPREAAARADSLRRALLRIDALHLPHR